MKNLILNKNLLGVLAASVLAAIPFFASAQIAEKPLDIDAQKNLLEVRADDIIDSVLFTPEVLNAEGKFEKLPVQQRYYYAGFPTDKTVVADEDNYSAVEKTAAGYKVYAADTFVYADGNWKTIENDVIEPSAFDAVMFDRVDPTLGDLLGGVFKAHAQTYAETADGFAGCSWLSNSYPWNNAACDNADTTDHTSAYIFSYSGQWDNRSGFFAFDTAFLNAAPSTAVLHLFYNDTWDSDVNTSVWATQGTQASAADLTIDDQWAYELTGGQEIEITSDNYEEHTADAMDWIDIDDYTKIAVISNDLYTESGSVTNSEMVAWYASEQSGTDYDPYLEIVESSGTSTPPTSTTTTDYASSTPGLTTTTATFFLFFAIVFVLGGLIILSWIRDIFS